MSCKHLVHCGYFEYETFEYYISDMKSEKVGGRKYYECPVCEIKTYQMRRHINRKHKEHPDLKVDLKKTLWKSL